MNKSDLVDHVREVARIERREAEKAVNALLSVIVDEIKSGNRVTISGFGSFAPKDVRAKSGVSSLTGKPWKTPPSKGLKFTPAVALKEALNAKAVAKKVAATKKAAAGAAAKASKTSKASKASKAPAKAAATAAKSTPKR